MHIRQALQADAGELTRISFSSKRYWQYPEPYYLIWSDELTITPGYIAKNRVYVCEGEDKAMGYYSLVELQDRVEIGGEVLPLGYWLEHMFVLPEYIGHKAGSVMINHLEKLCLELGIITLRVLVDPNAKGFYEKMGFSYIREYPSTISGRTTPLYEKMIGV